MAVSTAVFAMSHAAGAHVREKEVELRVLRLFGFERETADGRFQFPQHRGLIQDIFYMCGKSGGVVFRCQVSGDNDHG